MQTKSLCFEGVYTHHAWVCLLVGAGLRCGPSPRPWRLEAPRGGRGRSLAADLLPRSPRSGSFAA